MNDDLDYYGLADTPSPSQEPVNEPAVNEPVNTPDVTSDSEGLLARLIVDKGIVDVEKIKFIDDEGSIIEKSWKDLTSDERYSILSAKDDIEDPYNINEDEKTLVDMIRESKMSSKEFLENIKRIGAEEYMDNTYSPENISIDSFTDDELYVLDIQTKFPNISEEQIHAAYEHDKANEELFNVRIAQIRNEYKTQELAMLEKQKNERELATLEQQKIFNENVNKELQNFKNVGAFNLELENDDLDEIYNFITKSNKSGHRYLAEALNDPKKLVKMAWFATKGDEALSTIHDYYKNEISKVAKHSYEKGKAEILAKHGKLSIKTTTVDNNKPKDLFSEDL